MTFDLKIIIGHIDLYFMVQCFPLYLEDCLNDDSFFAIVSHCNKNSDLKMNDGHSDLYFIVQ